MKNPGRPRLPASHPSTLFEIPEPPDREVSATSAPLIGAPRLRTAVRDQIVSRAAALDDLIPSDRTARAIREYGVGLDLAVSLQPIMAVQGRPGRSPVDPGILLALRLHATTRGGGGARQLDAPS